MYPINNLHVTALVCYIAQQVVASILFHAHANSGSEDQRPDDYSAAEVEWFSNRITDEIWRNWNDLTTAQPSRECHRRDLQRGADGVNPAAELAGWHRRIWSGRCTAANRSASWSSRSVGRMARPHEAT